MTAILLQAQPTPVSADRFRALTGWTGLGIAILLIVLVCAIALISRHRVRLAAASRDRSPHTRPKARIDPWAESARRLQTPPTDSPPGNAEERP